MNIEIYLSHDPQDGPIKSQILLTRCQKDSKSEWVSTSFHKQVKSFDKIPVKYKHKSQQNGALTGLVAWLLQKQRGNPIAFSKKLSNQLLELIAQDKDNRINTWLASFFDSDPKNIFEFKAGSVLPKLILSNANITTYVSVDQSYDDLRKLSCKQLNNLDELKEVAAGVNPPVLSIKVEYKALKGAPASWKIFRPDRDELPRDHELTIEITCPNPVNIALACFSSADGAKGIWPWNPIAEGKWYSDEEIDRIIIANKNPKGLIRLPDVWNQNSTNRQPVAITATSRIECFLAITYRIENPESPNAHANVLKRLAKSIREIQMPPEPDQPLCFRIGPSDSYQETYNFWTHVRNIPGAVERCLRQNLEKNGASVDIIDFARALIIVSKT
jgi:hypothetical protein